MYERTRESGHKFARSWKYLASEPCDPSIFSFFTSSHNLHVIGVVCMKLNTTSSVVVTELSSHLQRKLLFGYFLRLMRNVHHGKSF